MLVSLRPFDLRETNYILLKTKEAFTIVFIVSAACAACY